MSDECKPVPDSPLMANATKPANELTDKELTELFAVRLMRNIPGVRCEVDPSFNEIDIRTKMLRSDNTRLVLTLEFKEDGSFLKMRSPF